MRRSTTPLPLVYFVTLCGGYIQMAFFPESPKIGTLVISKFWMFISSSNQAFLEHVKVTSYNPQKNLSKGVFHAPIEGHLTPALKGFVVKNI
jgi:hypothetical protein